MKKLIPTFLLLFLLAACAGNASPCDRSHSLTGSPGCHGGRAPLGNGRSDHGAHRHTGPEHRGTGDSHCIQPAHFPGRRDATGLHPCRDIPHGRHGCALSSR